MSVFYVPVNLEGFVLCLHLHGSSSDHHIVSIFTDSPKNLSTLETMYHFFALDSCVPSELLRSLLVWSTLMW